MICCKQRLSFRPFWIFTDLYRRITLYTKTLLYQRKTCNTTKHMALRQGYTFFSVTWQATQIFNLLCYDKDQVCCGLKKLIHINKTTLTLGDLHISNKFDMLTSNNVTYFFGLIHFSAAKIFLYKLKGKSNFTKTEGLPLFLFIKTVFDFYSLIYGKNISLNVWYSRT